jgi:hypothetical protein
VIDTFFFSFIASEILLSFTAVTGHPLFNPAAHHVGGVSVVMADSIRIAFYISLRSVSRP